MKNIIILLILLSSNAVFSMAQRDLKFVPQKNHGDELVNRRFYQLSYSNKHEQAEWVYYKLTTKMIEGDTKRSDRFMPDPAIKNKTPISDDYINTGFDRGHLLPAADMKISKKAMEETFYMSNVSPQKPGFNRKIWKSLEKKTRDFVKVKGPLYIITGPVLEKGLSTINRKITIPEYFYKIIIKKYAHKIETIAFVLPNSETDKPLTSFIVSIDEIEDLIGIDLFENLDNDVERQIESAIVNGSWDL